MQQKKKKKKKFSRVLMVDSCCTSIFKYLNQIFIDVPFDYIEIRTQQYEVIAKNSQQHRSQREKYSKNQPSELWRISFFYLLHCIINNY